MDDDFAHDREIQQARKEKKAYDQMVQACISHMQTELALAPSSPKNLTGFYSVKTIPNFHLLKSYKSTSPLFPLRVSLANYLSNYSNARTTNSGSDDYIFGVLSLRKSFPRTLIVPETIQEKVVDLFVRMDVDFPDAKRFSWKFHVVTENKDLLYDLLQTKQLDSLTPFANMEIEIQKSLCLFRVSRKAISLKEAKTFCQLAKTMNQVFN